MMVKKTNKDVIQIWEHGYDALDDLKWNDPASYIG